MPQKSPHIDRCGLKESCKPFTLSRAYNGYLCLDDERNCAGRGRQNHHDTLSGWEGAREAEEPEGVVRCTSIVRCCLDIHFLRHLSHTRPSR